ncbi:MAG: hypothetical protein KAS28_01060 [Desulfobacula sp.]|nr:hypothetical protein [Desulfobacula sp.]
MKNCIMQIFLLLLFTVVTISADEIPSQKNPVAFLPEYVFQFEPVVEGDKTIHDFIVQNKGSSALEIGKIESG